MLPKAIPDYRVLTYDYPAPVVAAFGLILTSENILGIATTMVTELAADCYVRTNPLASSEFFFFFFMPLPWRDYRQAGTEVASTSG